VGLSGAQRASLFAAGYVTVPGAVPRELCEAALRAINESLGRGLPPEDLPRFRARSFCPELQRERVITDLLVRSPAFALAESLVAPGRLERPGTGQIALSFPDPQATGRLHPHLDGLYTPANGVPKGSVLSFTMLAGVLLSDVLQPSAGNLVVWPGSHRLYEDYFRRHGPQSLLEGMPSVPLPEPAPVTGRAGDLVLCHYQLGHAAGSNTSPHVRYAVYFRLKHVGHDRHRWECLTDLWREWPALAGMATT